MWSSNVAEQPCPPLHPDGGKSRPSRHRDWLSGCSHAVLVAVGVPSVVLPLLLAPIPAEADVTFVTPIHFTFSDSSSTASNTIGSTAHYSITGSSSGDYVVLFTKAYGTFVNNGSLGLDSANSGSYEGIYLSSGTASLVKLTNNGTISVSNTYAGSTLASEGIYNYLSDGAGSIGTIINSGTITVSAGAAYGIANGETGSVQTISTIINSGTISATGVNYSAVGIRNMVGWIGSIQNSGEISAISQDSACVDASTGCIAAGILNSGTSSTIVSLNNQANGMISGSAYGIYNSGSVGTLSNSGTISGDAYAIYNSGTISTLSSDGLLNGAVFNSGYLGIDGAVSVTGNYSQSSGTLELGTSGELVVSGTASLSGGTVSASIASTGNYIAGTSRTLVSANSLISGADISITGPSQLAWVSSVSGSQYSVTYQSDYIGGSLGSLSNTGNISGYNYGVYVASTGVLGTLTNTGTIAGDVYAIYNAGDIGSIVNSGTILGDIYSSGDLTIVGGSGGTYGTLSDGTISIGSSGTGTLALTSGYLWLLDNVAGNVGNSGATVKLSSAVSISGDYSQSGGGLVIVTANSGTSYGYLTVSGAASVSNTAITISGSGLTSGETFTIVRASSGAYTSDTATVSGTSGLSATVSTNSGNLIVTLSTSASSSTNTYSSTGLHAGSNAGAMGTALDTLSNSGTISSGMQSILSAIDTLSSTEAKAQAIKELAPSQSTPSALMGFAAANLTSGAVEQHQQTAMAYDPSTGKAAGSESYQDALWGQVMGGSAVRSGSADADGYRIKQFGLAFGIDHMISDSLMGGAALSWVRGISHGADGSETFSILDSYQATAYGTWRSGRLFLDGQAGIGLNRFHQKRDIDFLSETATADYGGEQYLLRGQTGYDVPFKGDIKVTPLAGLTFLRAVNDGYTETGAGTADLTVDRHGSNSLAHDLGAKVSWATDTGWGRLRYDVRVEWIHDYRQSAITTNGSIDGAAFASTTSRLDPDGAQLGLGLTLDRNDALSIRAEYTGELRESYQSHVGSVKLIWGF